MTRLSTASPHGKKHVQNFGKRHRQHRKTDGEWQRKPAMPAYCRPKQRSWDTAFDADDAEFEAPHGA